MRFFKALAVMFSLCTLAAAAAPASYAEVEFRNATQYDTLVYISSLYPAQNWELRQVSCVHPQGSWRYKFHLTQPTLLAEVRVRADVKLHGCNNGTHGSQTRQVYVYRGQEILVSTLAEHPAGHFTLGIVAHESYR